MKKLFLLLFPVALMLAVVACEEKEPTPPEILNVSSPVFNEITTGEKSIATVTYELANAGELKPVAKVEGEGFTIVAEEIGSVKIEFASNTPGTYKGKLIISIEAVTKEVALEATANKIPETPETPDPAPSEPPVVTANDYVICNYNIRYYNGTSDNNNKGDKAWRKARRCFKCNSDIS